MRKTIMSLLNEPTLTALVPGGWHQQGSLDIAPERVFGTYRLRGSTQSVTSRSPSREVGLEVWVHDDPGSYLRIDDILKELERILDGVVHVSAAAGESISQTKFESRSPDLNDDGLRTICKMTSYTLIGKGQ
jgi:hypothetical protein